MLSQRNVPCALGCGLAAIALGACGYEQAQASESQPALSASASVAPAPEPAVTAAPPLGAGTAACPEGMRPVKGGRFRVGNDSEAAASEDRPAFETEVSAFCMDETEVTTAAYERCAQAGKCAPAKQERRFCNAGKPDRADHPVNCVDWIAADAYCAFRGARLPTEVEWEYAARGGSEYRAYSWGNEPPDGRTCWKHIGGTCAVRQFPSGAFGLHDVIGNVWEWTDDWFGDYPWPPAHGLTKVYRGGSWSRRFEKWMSPRLRNRYRPREWGTHLGFRCALTLPETSCAYGRTEDGKRCLHGVAGVRCPPRTSWNGQRCAHAGEPECPAGQSKRPGHGCVRELDVKGPAPEVESTPTARTRTPEHDADCLKNKPGRPNAYRYSGGTHHARNHVSAQAGCSNRDVGVGWNSCCCP